MSEAVAKLMPALLELTVDERLEAMDALAASLPGPASKFAEGTTEFDAELDRRRAEHRGDSPPGSLRK